MPSGLGSDGRGVCVLVLRQGLVLGADEYDGQARLVVVQYSPNPVTLRRRIEELTGGDQPVSGYRIRMHENS